MGQHLMRRAGALLAWADSTAVHAPSAKQSQIGDLDPMFRALVNGEISVGRAREIVREWQDGLPWTLPGDRFPS